MSINRTATAAGKKYERDLLTYLRDQNLDVERLRLAGVEDEGDLLLRTNNGQEWNGTDRFVIEAKREKGFKLGPWLAEAESEAENYQKHRLLSLPPGFVVVHARRNHRIGKSYVTTTLDEWLRQIA